MRHHATAAVLAFLFLLPFSSAAQDKNMYLYKELELNLRIDNTVLVQPESDDYYIDFVTANLSWYPKDDYRQKRESFIATPHALVGESIEYSWNQPKDISFPFSLESKILTRNKFVEIHKKIPFPMQEIPQDLKPYLEPQEITDTNREIRRKAAQLVEGKDDLYDVVFTLADWVKENVNYNLSSTTANAAQKSSWVIKNKQGVCDEITSLFISMSRSLGIPAKFVSGMAYTDLPELGMTFGPHGWAEVYFPGIGWVPFDPTYREMGYLDATHIKLQEALDAKTNSVEYLSRGRDITIKGGPLNIKVDTLQKGVVVPPSIDLKVFVNATTVGFGSYNLITADVTNREEYYLTADLQLARTNELELIDGEYRTSVMMRPREKRTLSWIVRVTERLAPGYTYTFPVEVIDIRGARADASFTAKQDAIVHSYSEFKGTVAPAQKARSDLSCSVPEPKVAISSQVAITCDLANLEDYTKAYTVCIKAACSRKDVASMATETFTIPLAEKVPGINNVVISAKYKGEENRAYLLMDFLVHPNITITGITHPSTIRYDENGTISFTLSKNPESVAKNIRLSLSHPKLKKDWAVPSLDAPQEFRIIFYGNNLKEGENAFTLNASWQDDAGQHYQTRETFTTTLTGVTLWQSIALFFDDIETSIFG